MFDEIPIDGASQWYFQEDEDGVQDKTVKQILSPVTELLIWQCMGVDLNGITKKNIDEWMFRLFCLEITRNRNTNFMVSDFHETKGWQQRRLCKQDLIDHIGLSTNVSTKTRLKFWKKLMPTERYNASFEARWKEETEEEV